MSSVAIRRNFRIGLVHRFEHSVVRRPVAVVEIIQCKEPLDIKLPHRKDQRGKCPGSPPVAVNKRVNPHEFVMRNPGNEHRVHLVRSIRIQPGDESSQQRGNVFWRRGRIHNFLCVPVPDHDPDLPYRPLGCRVIEGILRDVMVEREEMFFRDLTNVLVCVDMFQHPQVVEHLVFFPPCCHHVPAFSQPAHFFKRERVSFNRGGCVRSPDELLPANRDFPFRNEMRMKDDFPGCSNCSKSFHHRVGVGKFR
jgi:hypothetical protein